MTTLTRVRPRPRRSQEARPSILVRAQVRFAPGELDRGLAGGADPERDQALGLRARHLTSARHRGDVALGLERVLQATGQRPPTFSAAVPLRRREIRGARPWLLQLAERLRSDEAVRPKGVALAERLLTHGAVRSTRPRALRTCSEPPAPPSTRSEALTRRAHL